MKPIKDWRRVARRAWSVRLIVLAAVLSGLESIVPLLGVPPWATFGVVAGALVARFVAQPGMKGDSSDGDA